MGEYKLTKDDYEKLTAVDKINEIIKNMSCLDPEVAANALKEADELTKQLNAAQGYSRSIVIFSRNLRKWWL